MNAISGNERVWRHRMHTGQGYFERRGYREAIANFSKATQLAPHRVEGWVNLGSALVENKEFETAVRILQHAVAMNPQLMVSHMILGDAQRQLGHRAQATDSYDRAVTLQRTPLVLNKLACVLRSSRRVQEAQALYQEAIDMEPGYSLPRVNCATMQIERRLFDKAGEQLRALQTEKLPPIEAREVASALSSLGEYQRLQQAIAEMALQGDLTPLALQLADAPRTALGIDRAALQTLEAYVPSAKQSGQQGHDLIELPQEWPLIESLYMIPLAHGVEHYRELKHALSQNEKMGGQLEESYKMVAMIDAARASRDDLSEPWRMELHLRHWHALACGGLEDFMPGHFKYTQNWSGLTPTLTRVDPAMASGTLRYVFEELYPQVPAGLARAAFVFLAIADLHPFEDGNGRVALTWLNRELEWAGLMPAIFAQETGIKEEMSEAEHEVRINGGDLTPMLSVIIRGQAYARDFCQQLAN